jgi:hypothetical protein
MKSIEKIIKEILLREKESGSTIKIDESHFFSVLIEKGNNKKMWNFVCLFIAVIVCVTILITSFVFFINDVLLFQNNSKLNQMGAIISERSCKRETTIFLFGSAQRWANTGIQLQKGDEIKISYSGGFNSDIVGLKEAAETNDTLRYKWISFSNDTTPTDSLTRKRLLYNDEKDARFGSLLYVIAGEMGVADEIDTDIYQVEQNKAASVKQNGVLYLAVNDIYLTDTVIRLYEKDNKRLIPIDSSITKTTFDKYKDSIDLFYKYTDTLYIIAGKSFIDYFSKNRELFYQDNLGEVLVVVDIKRHINAINLFQWATLNPYSRYYRCAEENPILVLICSVLFLTVIALILIYRKTIIKLFYHTIKK